MYGSCFDLPKLLWLTYFEVPTLSYLLWATYNILDHNNIDKTNTFSNIWLLFVITTSIKWTTKNWKNKNSFFFVMTTSVKWKNLRETDFFDHILIGDLNEKIALRDISDADVSDLHISDKKMSDLWVQKNRNPYLFSLITTLIVSESSEMKTSDRER